jgi:hypothetical protein
MLMMRSGAGDHDRAATFYAEAADNYERLGLVTNARHLAKKRG